jgi:hypothetical protein
MCFGAGLKLNLGIVSADVNFAKGNKAKEFVIYEPQVFAFGIGRSNAGWNFESSEERGIWGNKKNLILIIKSPKNSNIPTVTQGNGHAMWGSVHVNLDRLQLGKPNSQCHPRKRKRTKATKNQ